MKKVQNKLSSIKGAARGRNLRIILWCAGVTVLWRICLELINQEIVPLMNLPPGHARNESIHASLHFFVGLHRWITWDAGWYKLIAQHGYVIQHNLKGQETIAFFPLFPILTRFTSWVLHIPIVAAGMLLNFIAVIITTFFIYKMTERFAAKAGRKDTQLAARFAVILFLIYPSSFFFASLYADALLVMCVTIGFYFALRESFFWAAVFAGLASGTKSIGAVMLPVLIVMYLQTNTKDLKSMAGFIKNHLLKLLLLAALSLSGLIAYMIYLLQRFGSPLLFVKNEKYWEKTPGSGSALHNLWHHDFVRVVKIHTLRAGLYDIFVFFIPILTLAFIIFLLYKYKLKFSWLALLCFLTIVIPMSTGRLAGINRYVMILTPAISLIAAYSYTDQHRTLRHLLHAWVWLSAILLMIFTAMFLDIYGVG